MVDTKVIKDRMESSLEVFKKNLGGVRAGRASPDMLNNIRVDAYGSPMPVSQLANISVSDSSMLTVQVWDKTLVASVLKAIQTSDLGVNPINDADVIRVPLPKLSEERRKELAKLCATYSEQAKVSVRNIRRDEIDDVKNLQKNSEISEDDLRSFTSEIQDITDEYTKIIDKLLSEKQSEILKV